MQAGKTHPAVKILKHAKFQDGSHEPGVRRTIRGAKAWLGSVDQVLYHIRQRGRPKEGLSTTILVPDKSRAFGLKGFIKVTPSWTQDIPKGLILKGEPFEPSRDLMEV